MGHAAASSSAAPKWCHAEGWSQKCFLPRTHKDSGVTNATWGHSRQGKKSVRSRSEVLHEGLEAELSPHHTLSTNEHYFIREEGTGTTELPAGCNIKPLDFVVHECEISTIGQTVEDPDPNCCPPSLMQSTGKKHLIYEQRQRKKAWGRNH